ncbi:uncharacterized protein [Diadema antillarum]|uniref:uncharacterized protein n=1 Tax=Diadema antillarum TaxID=105358 RepID=UPI003A894CEC
MELEASSVDLLEMEAVENLENLSTMFNMADERLVIQLPNLPIWMLDTPMYSKLPMVPAPKGRIQLFTTSLCKKLHQQPDGLEFDPVAAGLCCEYKSLHDPHLKSHYTRPVTYERLVKSGHITADGMVRCTLKEFNEYHQYLKSVRLEKLTQDRKRYMAMEKERMERERKQSIQKDVSERDRLIKESLFKQKKILDAERAKLSRKLKVDCRKTMIRLLDQRRMKQTMQKRRRKANEEKHKAMRMSIEVEDKLKKAIIQAKRNAREVRRTDRLTEWRKKEKEEQERKLEDQWNRREKARAKRLLEEARKFAKRRDEMYEKAERREHRVAKHREKQQDLRAKIREERQKSQLEREVMISAKLEKKLASVCRKYTAAPKRGRRCFPPINPKVTTNMTTWNIEERQRQLQDGLPKGEALAGGAEQSADRLPPIITSGESEVDRKRSGPPSLAIFNTSSLPTVTSSEFSKEILTTVEELDLSEESSGLAMGDTTSATEDGIDPFSRLARQMVLSLLDELKEDPEFADVDWTRDGEDEEEGKVKESQGETGLEAQAVEGPSSQDSYVDLENLSRHASLLVANAINKALASIQQSDAVVKEPTVEERAASIVSSAIEGALKILRPEPSFHAEQKEAQTVSQQALAITSGAIEGAIMRLQAESVEEPRGQPKAEVQPSQCCQGSEVGSEVRSEKGINSIIDVFQDPAESVPSISHTLASEDSESEEEADDSVIAILDNSGGGEGAAESGQALLEGGLLSIEGAVVVTSSHSAILSGEDTVTGRIMSGVDLDRSSGTLSDKQDGGHRDATVARSDLSSSSGEEEEVINTSSGSSKEPTSFSIIPMYQKNMLNIGSDVIECNLTAISQKPDASGSFPGAGKCGARNSFRSLFRPDMTYCQGSARALRDTLVRDISSRCTTGGRTAAVESICEVLEKEEQDIMEKHSDEALVATEETSGLCYLPKKRKIPSLSAAGPTTPANTAVSSTISALAQPEGSPSNTPEENGSKHEIKEKVDAKEEGPVVDNQGPLEAGSGSSVPAVASASDAMPGGPKDDDGVETKVVIATRDDDMVVSADKLADESKTDMGGEAPVKKSMSASSARDRASSRGNSPAKQEFSVQSVDASPNLAVSQGNSEDGGPSSCGSSSGEDSGSKKRGSRHSKKVTRSSSLISGVMSRLSHVFSSTRRQSNTSCPSHESTSEPASRQISKKSIDTSSAATNQKVAVDPAGVASSEVPEMENEKHDQQGGLGIAEVHRGASVRFASISVDAPEKKTSIYASVRPQTPVAAHLLGRPLSSEEEEEEEENGVDDDKEEKGESGDVAVVADAIQVPVFSIDVASGVGLDLGGKADDDDDAISFTDNPMDAVAKETETANEEEAKKPPADDDASENTGDGEGREKPDPKEEDEDMTSDQDPKTSALSVAAAKVASETNGVAPEVTEASPEAVNTEPGTANTAPGTANTAPEVTESAPAAPENLLEAAPAENDSNNANTEGASQSGSKPPSRLPSIQTSQLRTGAASSSSSSRTSNRSKKGAATPSGSGTTAAAARSGSRTSSGAPKVPLLQAGSKTSNTGPSPSISITGRGLTPINSKSKAKLAASSTTGRQKTSSGRNSPSHVRSDIGQRSSLPSTRRSENLRSQHSRATSPKKGSSVTSQSASKVMSAYGTNSLKPAALCVTGSQILTANLSRMQSGGRRSSRTQNTLVSATDLVSRGSSRSSNLQRRGSKGSKGGSGTSVLMPHPPQGARPAVSSQSSHRGVEQPGSQPSSNPALATTKGGSSVLIHHRSSSERLLPRRPSLEKENRMERLSTENVTRKRSSQEKVEKKASSEPPAEEEGEVPQPERAAAPMPPIKKPLTPRPPDRPKPSDKSGSHPGPGTEATVEKQPPEGGQAMLGDDQARPEE